MARKNAPCHWVDDGDRAVIWWFSGASMRAVAIGAYRAVELIRPNIKLETRPRPRSPPS